LTPRPAEPTAGREGDMTTILFVEDEGNLRELYVDELGREGYEILLAVDGKQAVEMSQRHKPDLVVMDISMPKMDGIEAMGKILSCNNTIPVILNTAYSSYQDNFMSWAADAYVVKSSDLTELKQTIKEVLDARQAQQKGAQGQ